MELAAAIAVTASAPRDVTVRWDVFTPPGHDLRAAIVGGAELGFDLVSTAALGAQPPDAALIADPGFRARDGDVTTRPRAGYDRAALP